MIEWYLFIIYICFILFWVVYCIILRRNIVDLQQELKLTRLDLYSRALALEEIITMHPEWKRNDRGMKQLVESTQHDLLRYAGLVDVPTANDSSSSTDLKNSNPPKPQPQSQTSQRWSKSNSIGDKLSRRQSSHSIMFSDV